jgi:hypothetical protein
LFDSSRTEDSEIVFKEDVSIEAFREFVRGCQFEEYEIKAETVFDIELLCERWEVDSIHCEVRQFITNSSNLRSLLIPSIIFKIRHNLESSSYEEIVSNELEYFIEDSSIFEVPFSHFHRMIDKVVSKSDSPEEYFEILMKSLSHYGGIASMLFRSLDISKLTSSQIATLLEHEEFEWNFLGCNQSKIAMGVINSNSRLEAKLFHHHELIESLISRLSFLENIVKDQEIVVSGLSNDHRDFTNRLERLEKRIESIEKVQTEMRIEMTKSIEANSVETERHLIKCQQIETQQSKIEKEMKEGNERNELLVSEIALVKKKSADVEEEQLKQMKEMKALKEMKDEVMGKIDRERSGFVTQSELTSLRNEMTEMQRFVVKQFVRNFPFSNSDPMKGIVGFLTGECGGNVHDTGIVTAIASGILNNNQSYHPEFIADLETDTRFCSPNSSNSWVGYDFKERRILPTHYSMRSANCPKGWHHPRSWVIEISANGTDWRVVDEQNNIDTLNGPRQLFQNEISGSSFTRFIRVRMTGKDSAGRDYLTFSAFEVFGFLL